eukprot:15473347-Alexandrium_andersonii.AAC.1
MLTVSGREHALFCPRGEDARTLLREHASRQSTHERANQRTNGKRGRARAALRRVDDEGSLSSEGGHERPYAQRGTNPSPERTRAKAQFPGQRAPDGARRSLGRRARSARITLTSVREEGGPSPANAAAAKQHRPRSVGPAATATALLLSSPSQLSSDHEGPEAQLSEDQPPASTNRSSAAPALPDHCQKAPRLSEGGA